MNESIARWIRQLLWSAVLLVAGMAIASFAAPRMLEAATPGLSPALPMVRLNSELLNETERVYSEIYNRVAPAVVSITSATRSGDQFFNVSGGSGFVIDTQGHIVTNFHVVEGAARLEVSMFDGTIARGELIGTDADSDIAVIKINIAPERLRPVPLGNSDEIEVGQIVLAIGSPFENDWTMTSGIVSALNRRISGLNNNSIGGVIQTDAAINPGNSGGPLLNLRGEVIGVNSQIESQTRSNSGIGFAVPSNLVQRVANELIADGFVNYSFIGILSRPINLDLIEAYRLPDNMRGVAVRQAQPGFPASTAGLRTMSDASIDVITAIDGTPIRNFDQLIGYLAINTAPGQTVTLTVYRDGQVLSLPLTLTERPNRR